MSYKKYTVVFTINFLGTLHFSVGFKIGPNLGYK